jgi:AraC-like DNA-binding protein
MPKVSRSYQKALFLTPEQIELLAAIGCTDTDIAALAGASEAHIQKKYRAELTTGRAKLRERLRRRQVERAMEGSDQMLIWLGKQYLEQRDRSDQRVTLEQWDVVIGEEQASDADA